jgi:3-mercaptopyruvate sulfurtransferase SseA
MKYLINFLFIPVFSLSSLFANQLIDQKEALKLLKSDQAVFIKIVEKNSHNTILIKGSYSIQKSDIINEDGSFKSLDQIKVTIDKKGINLSKPIVLYDDNGYIDAGAFYWVLKNLGIENISILRGGQSEWIKNYKKYISENANEGLFENDIVVPDQYVFSASDSDLKKASRSFETKTIGIFMNSKDKEVIQSSISLYYYSFLDPYDQIVDSEQIGNILAEYGINAGGQYILYSDTGYNSGFLFFLMDQTGYKNILIYPGKIDSWKDNNLDHSI